MDNQYTRQNGGAAAWLFAWPFLILLAGFSLALMALRRNALRFSLAVCFVLCVCLVSGCVSGNKAEANLIKVEKPSTAKEVDQYVTTAGKSIDWALRLFKKN